MAFWQKNIIILPLNQLQADNNIMLTDKSVAKQIWLRRELNSKGIIIELDKLISRADWVNSEDWIYWKGDTENYEDNDVTLIFDKETKLISAFEFRFDLRTNSTSFIENIINICHNFQLGFVIDNKIIKPITSDYLDLITKSSFQKNKFPNYKSKD